MLITQCVLNPALAQGEWKWAHYWSGSGGSYNNIFNNVTNTAFDEEGNVYVYGTMGGNPVLDGNELQFSGDQMIMNTVSPAILLAKFDTLGNMLWYKMVRCSNSDGGVSRPHWMEVRNNKIHISGSTALTGFNSWGTWLYYMDTLIRKTQVDSIPQTEQKPPFKISRWTFFAQLDLDGNILDNHFVETYSRESYLYEGRLVEPLCMLQTAPMHVDNNGNTYIYTFLEYKGNEENPFTLMVDGDSNKSYDIYLPGTWQEDSRVPYLHNMLICKFSPSGELVFAKRMVDHTEGIVPSWEYLRDSINPSYYACPTGLSFDDEDNMYVSGYLIVAMHDYDNGGQLHQYPVHIYWDSIHYATIQDMSGAARLNFVIKYDTNGNVQWCNQIYTKGSPSGTNYSHAEWKGNCIDEQSLYILGAGAYTPSSQANIYFDTENNNLQRYIPTLTGIGFIVKYNKQSGQYLAQGIIPDIDVVTSATPACISNRIFALAKSVYYQKNTLTEWKNNGIVIKTDTVICVESDIHNSQGLTSNENDYLLLSMRTYSSVTFNENIQADCNVPYLDKAVFALYHNPEFVTPFVPDDTVAIDEYFQKRESDIYLYPNPTDRMVTVCGYIYDYKSVELFDMQGRKLDKIVAMQNFAPAPSFDLSPYPAGIYLVKINFNRGVSVVRKLVKR